MRGRTQHSKPRRKQRPTVGGTPSQLCREGPAAAPVCNGFPLQGSILVHQRQSDGFPEVSILHPLAFRRTIGTPAAIHCINRTPGKLVGFQCLSSPVWGREKESGVAISTGPMLPATRKPPARLTVYRKFWSADLMFLLWWVYQSQQALRQVKRMRHIWINSLLINK